MVRLDRSSVPQVLVALAFSLVLSLACAPPARAQEETASSPSDTLVSPRVFPDGRVRISIYAPQAEEVAVMGDYGGWSPTSLTRGEDGVWSTTLGPLPPNLYNYMLQVDGVSTVDPSNPRHKGGISSVSSLFFVSGEEADYISVRDVPRGKVERVWYRSFSLKTTRRMHVYTPPGYGQNEEPLPVLYLLHGGGDTDAQWTGIGRANVILDNLIAAGEAEPMVVVMPAGHTPGPGGPTDAGMENDPFVTDLIGSVIPYVEAHYDVSSERTDRAIAGLSMGGFQTLNAALFHPEIFGYVMPLSTGLFGDAVDAMRREHSDVLENPAIDEFELFWIATGDDDQLVAESLAETLDLFDEYGIDYTYHETDGGHTWLVWRRNLRTFAPMLFR